MSKKKTLKKGTAKTAKGRVERRTETVSLTLLENGLDYLEFAVERLAAVQPTRRDLKQAVLNLGAAIELILKERLRRKNWRLIFKKPKKATLAEYRRGDFRSASIDQVFERLESDCRVIIAPTDQQLLTAYRYRRNRIQHFRLKDSSEAIIAASTRLISFLLAFIGAELVEKKLASGERAIIDRIREALGACEEYVRRRLAEIGSELANAHAVLECPRCGQETSIIDDGIWCAFCGHKDSGDAAAEEYAETIMGLSAYEAVKDGGEMPVRTCPSCGSASLARVGFGGSMMPETEFVCFTCAGQWEEGELHECSSCAELFIPAETEVVCADCYDDGFRRF